MCLGMVIGIARGTAESKPPVHCIRHPLPPAVRRRVGDRRYLRKETLPDGTIFAKTPDAECRVNDHLALHSTASAQTADAPSPGYLCGRPDRRTACPAHPHHGHGNAHIPKQGSARQPPLPQQQSQQRSSAKAYASPWTSKGQHSSSLAPPTIKLENTQRPWQTSKCHTRQATSLYYPVPQRSQTPRCGDRQKQGANIVVPSTTIRLLPSAWHRQVDAPQPPLPASTSSTMRNSLVRSTFRASDSLMYVHLAW